MGVHVGILLSHISSPLPQFEVIFQFDIKLMLLPSSIGTWSSAILARLWKVNPRLAIYGYLRPMSPYLSSSSDGTDSEQWTVTQTLLQVPSPSYWVSLQNISRISLLIFHKDIVGYC